jgi:Arc/MetJ-type ribon-helix-helix transcriptional regulator
MLALIINRAVSAVMAQIAPCSRFKRSAARVASLEALARPRRQHHTLSAKGLAKHAEDLGIVTRANSTSRFPFLEPFQLRDGRQASSSEIIRAMRPLMTQDRLEKIQRVAAERTFDVVPVIEGVYDKGNVAAVARSCDGALPRQSGAATSTFRVLYLTSGCSAALGYGQLNIITNRVSYKRSARTSRGSDKWLDVVLWQEPVACVRALQEQGRKVYVTDLSPSAVDVRVRLDQVLFLLHIPSHQSIG